MSETMETMQTEATTPEVDIAEGAGAQPTETPAEAPATEQPEATTPPETPAAEAEAQPPAPWSLPVKFRREHRELNYEDAVRYAQMGLSAEAQQPMMDQLRLMAAARGQSVTDFVASWSEAERLRLKDEKLQTTNGDEAAAEILVNAELERRRQACDMQDRQEQEAAQQAEQTLQDRLAAEFNELQQACPDFAQFSDLPEEVVKEAIRDNRHLYDAYLRYQHREGKKIEQNTAAQAAAAAASAGSQADQPPVGVNPAIAAAMRAVDEVFG